MKSIKTSIWSIAIVSTILFSCKKESTAPVDETWQFTKLVNANLDNDGNMLSLDFYQQKGDQWRIVQMAPDDYTKFYLTKIITPNTFELPELNTNAFMTSNVRFFNPSEERVYNQGDLKWLMGSPIQFKSYNTFNAEFPDMPLTYNKIEKFSGSTFSKERAYDYNPKTSTYLFYDFPNQKYVYYAIKSGTDYILENNLSILCPTCNTINWADMDAVTCNVSNNAEDLYYFFDFDNDKMYILTRLNKDTNNASFVMIDATFKISEAFYNEAGSNGGEELPFDFSK
ncbi:MAG: hypothetical protein IPN93_05640 [Bacteroidetes bacterium]|jgi:hypothetical protein|nr:hypothetical protein [Bacteroidota bacterium]MBP7257483.1 hypothetical protein [Chitinophagales bacterium]MBK9635596.1 hypothetical protein [Bacteroidota bacterium]MBL0078199.1 hypothetical protein [Bacteroidota bacterium]MBL0288190.1 hypothetical protein [Bacteroidota bacterium]